MNKRALKIARELVSKNYWDSEYLASDILILAQAYLALVGKIKPDNVLKNGEPGINNRELYSLSKKD